MGNKQDNKQISLNNTKEETISTKGIKNRAIKSEKINNNQTKEIYKYNILFVGEPGIGTKTSLIKRIKEGKFINNIEKNQVYKEKIIYEKDDKKIMIYLIDTNSENEYRYLDITEDKRKYTIKTYSKNADCIIMGYDITNKQSFQEIKSFWYKEINNMAKTNLIYLLGNKIDLKDNIEVNESEVKEFTDTNKIKYFSISVKNDINIQNLIFNR